MPVEPTTLALDRAIRSWVAEGSRLAREAVIPGNAPNTPSRRGLYATVLEIDSAPDGQNFARLSPGDEARNVDEMSIQSVLIQYSVQWYRVGARDAGKSFQLWASSPAGVEGAEQRGFTFYLTSSLRRLDGIDKAEWEERAGLDLSIGVLVRERREVPKLDGVRVDICLDEEAEAQVTAQGVG